ncbi:copper chaperone PCu(A)C [Erythrobacter sp.]|jgi:copper(I)-binding protein|uniref:copper chaperone PCu(A)C n=1 Tax=Erythrobacter sp. TaxID=1042 RepID=UPI002EA3508B|nr:copper chaperone PCu(A)C [Erythrobacter sp.]
MTNSLPYLRILPALALAGAALTLTACEEEAAPPAPAADVVEGLTITDPRLVLAPVSGNPAAVYFDLAYDGTRALTLYDAEVEGAGSATIHQFGEYDFKVQMMEALPIPLTQGTEIAFEPGDYHVMAMEVSPELEAGGTAKVTLKLSGGGTHSFDAEIRAAGDER